MQILAIGDVIGKPGTAGSSETAARFTAAIPDLDLVIANGENAAGGWA